VRDILIAFVVIAEMLKLGNRVGEEEATAVTCNDVKLLLTHCIIDTFQCRIKIFRTTYLARIYVMHNFF
jgi:hypothetical protein